MKVASHLAEGMGPVSSFKLHVSRGLALTQVASMQLTTICPQCASWPDSHVGLLTRTCVTMLEL